MNYVLPGQFVAPDVVTSQFHLRLGDRVADFGAGNGFFLKPLSEAVGPDGHVYACEIQKTLVDKLGDFARLSGLSNIHPLWCDLEEMGGIKLQNNSLDSGILVNTLFQLERKEDALREMLRVIRPGGVLHIIDWSESFGGLGPQSKDVLTKQQAIDLLESVGFVLETEFPTGNHHYGVSFRKV